MKKYLDIFSKFKQFFKKGADERSLSEKLRDHYRLILVNEDSYSEVASLRLTPLNFYTFFSSIIVATAVIVTLLIVYTPLKRYIPGYGDTARTREISDLKGKVRDMEKEIAANQTYQNNLRNIMNGDIEALSKEDTKVTQDSNEVAVSDMNADVERIAEDEILRKAVATETSIPVKQGNGAALNITTTSKQAYIAETPLEKVFFMAPLSGGDVTSAFDQDSDHLGIDVSGVKNAAIRATHDGVVISAGFTIETGYSIAIQHPDNVITIYKHNSVLLKKAGSAVKQGEAIAIIGNTGEQSTGPHLHFELWYRGKAVNPADYISFQ
jgi:murein DD-endopeptidase MepM/ murein hydrolase activator NlpD